jgi:hypothetical protein
MYVRKKGKRNERKRKKESKRRESRSIEGKKRTINESKYNRKVGLKSGFLLKPALKKM